MENAECKRREVAKNKNYARKRGRKPQERTKKTKGKQNLRPLMRRRHKCDGRGVDDMFLRNLCTQGITKASPSVVEQAWKCEHVNKVFGIGKVCLQKGKLAIPSRRRGKGDSGVRDSKKLGKSCFAFEESPADSPQDFECSLSPISPPLTRIQESTAHEMPEGRRKLNLEEELHAFSLKYQAVVGAQILPKLPEDGVLEDALSALRKLQKTNRDEDPETEEPLLGSQVEFSRNDLEAEDYILRENFLEPEEQFCEGFIETPLENMFIMNPPAEENGDHSSYFSNESKSATVESQTKDFQKPVKELRIATPPIQFYRRNMF